MIDITKIKDQLATAAVCSHGCQRLSYGASDDDRD